MATVRVNAVVGQSGGPSAAINSTLAGVIEGCRASGAIGTLYGMRNGVEGLLKENLIDLFEAVPSEKIPLLQQTPAAALGSCRLKLPKTDDDAGRETYDRLFEIFEKYGIGVFFYIGGNDSMDTASKLSKEAAVRGSSVRFIGVPKTIDNDLVSTDHTPGYGCAAKFVAASLREIRRDCAVYTKKAVTVVEVMGRDSGWLTAAAALADVDGIYLPERPFSTEQFLADVAAAMEKRPDVLVAVSEGIRDADGHYIGEAGYKGQDIFGHVNLSGAGKALEMLVKEKIGCKVRSVELNVLQRCASHIASKTDLDEGFAVGKAAVDAAMNGRTGVMMTLVRESDSPYVCIVGCEDVCRIANEAKMIPDAWINAAGNGVTQECVNYIRPLIQGEWPVVYEDGLPVQLVL